MKHSTLGRPRVVTDEMVAEIVAWARKRETGAQFAKRLGISTSTLRAVIRTGGQHFKTSARRKPA